ncbi:DNA-binding response regulator [Arachidicoccus ginsenosidimutans]|uniref:LytR/AlgR family response regulator transcription factor n=1 Tax=Arachidicoccus sp. BS20 TaxID=1850526 RepID=UPI0007F0ED78|nr:LytTR family transcriptional regulator DNA-binding domain-containing protein [Arachidicoccus sp. BS20]ANI90257.1 DNA-binding response regulator [Arachidicoccus sp. BS20]
MRTIIIDDEPLARSLLTELLESEKNIEVIAECGDGFEGLKAIQELNPDLIFLDIQMPKITGFEMLELLDNPPHVIFTTAYDEYALKAFDVNALDYLLKPVNPERLSKALEKLSRQSSVVENSIKEKIPHLPEQAQRIVVKVNGNIKILPLPEVFYLESADDYVKIHTADKYYLKHQTMSRFEDQLPEQQFVRIHRSYLVNVQHIHKVDLYEKDQYCVVLRNDVRLPVSRSGYAKLKAVLGI